MSNDSDFASADHDDTTVDEARVDEATIDLGVADDEQTDEVEIDLGALDATDDQAEEDDTELNLDFGGDEPAEDAGINLDFGAEDEAQPSSDEQPEGDDEDALTEKALAELRDELRTKIGDWYVIHTYSGMENRVKQNLDARIISLEVEDYVYETVVPTEEVVEIRNGAKKTVTRCVLPGYVLVRMDMTEKAWGAVRHTPSVTGFVGHATNPVPLSLDEVERMLTPSVIAKANAAAAGKPARKSKKKIEVVDYSVGDSVEVVDGPFAGMHATITEINVNTQRLKAVLEIMGRETPVDLTFPQIQKV